MKPDGHVQVNESPLPKLKKLSLHTHCDTPPLDVAPSGHDVQAVALAEREIEFGAQGVQAAESADKL